MPTNYTKKTKEMFPWILHALDTAPMPSRVHKPHYLLVKDPINILLTQLKNYRIPDWNITLQELHLA